MKINDIIGKTWLASLDDSEGYVLSFKLIEQNSSSSVSLGKEQEEEATSISIGKNLPNNASSENSEKIINQPINLASTKKLTIRYSPRKAVLLGELTKYFLEKDKNLQYFVEEINGNKQATEILQIKIKYQELGTTPSGKIIGLVNKFEEQDSLDLLKEIFENCKTYFELA
jgi:hypothetical protein